MRSKQENIRQWIILSKAPRLGPAKFKQLMGHFDSPEKILSASFEELSRVPKIDRDTLDYITSKAKELNVEKDLDRMDKLGVSLVSIKNSEYPFNLKTIFDPPFVLYVRGELKKEDENSVAMVGTRRATNYGKIIARRLSRDLAKEGITVVSGMARGIDTSVHWGALEAGGRTIAVLGCGVDVIYPFENKELMEAIVEKGAVISEFPLGTIPHAQNFPRRNRIISGLSKGVVVAEAPFKSGALITANFALEQGREVFAVPGNVTNPYSYGSNLLIKEGAKLVGGVEDILEELNIYFREEKAKLSPSLSNEEEIIVGYLSEEPLHINVLVKKSNLSPAKVAESLIRLEIKGLVRELPGKLFIKE